MESIIVENDFTEAKPIQYLNYGPYSSGAPTYDSSFSSLTKKESDLVLSFYGSQNGLDYIQSLRAFVADSSPALVQQIDGLANVWTGDKHSEVCYTYSTCFISYSILGVVFSVLDNF